MMIEFDPIDLTDVEPDSLDGTWVKQMKELKREIDRLNAHVANLNADRFSLGEDIEVANKRIAELEALTKRQVRRTGQLTGEVDKYLRRIAELEAKINAAINIGHADECMFCGFKDKALSTDIVEEWKDSCDPGVDKLREKDGDTVMDEGWG
jgi:chromosome segregation ATPase